MSTDSEPDIITSPLSRQITGDGITVSVEIYRFKDDDGWVLEVVDADSNSIVWEDTFATDRDAWDYLQAEIHLQGLRNITVFEEEGCLH